MKLRFRALATLVLITVFTACTACTALAAPTTQRSSDNRFELTVPDGWKTTNYPGDERYELTVADSAKGYFVALTSTAKEDLVDQSLPAYEEQALASFNALFTDIEPGAATETTINGHPAMQRIVRCVQSNVRWVYYCTAIETEKSFVYIMCCSTPSRHNAARGAFDQIIASFREVGETSATSQPTDRK